MSEELLTEAVFDMKPIPSPTEEFLLTPTGQESGGISFCCEADVTKSDCIEQTQEASGTFALLILV